MALAVPSTATLDVTAAAIGALDGLSIEQRALVQQLVAAQGRTRRPISLRDFKTAARREEIGLPDYWDVQASFGSLAEALRLVRLVP